MDDGGDTRDDLKLPSGDIGNNIQNSFDKGEELIVSTRHMCFNWKYTFEDILSFYGSWKLWTFFSNVKLNNKITDIFFQTKTS